MQKTVKREELFIVTKLYNTEKEPKEELKSDLEEIGLSYFDLVLIHWYYYF